MNKVLIFSIFILAFGYKNLNAQNFYVEKTPKRDYYKIGLGTGIFFTSPRETLQEIENKFSPVVSIGLGRRYSNHFSLNVNASIQPYASVGTRTDERINQIVRNQIFKGMAYTFDIMPEFNIIPYFHHLNRPNLDLHFGMGVGILQANQSEIFEINNREFRLHFYKSSFYIPFRVAIAIKTGLLTNLSLEGKFLYTFLNPENNLTNIQLHSENFGQINLVYKKFLRNRK